MFKSAWLGAGMSHPRNRSSNQNFCWENIKIIWHLIALACALDRKTKTNLAGFFSSCHEWEKQRNQAAYEKVRKKLRANCFFKPKKYLETKLCSKPVQTAYFLISTTISGNLNCSVIKFNAMQCNAIELTKFSCRT